VREGKVIEQGRGFQHEQEALVGEATGAKGALVGEKKPPAGKKDVLVDETEMIAGEKEALLWRVFEVVGTRETLDVKRKTVREAIDEKVEFVAKDVGEGLEEKKELVRERTRRVVLV
jgi:hypothetical protein